MTQVARISPGTLQEQFSVRVPGSKSITNRLLLLAAVAGGRSILKAPLVADDTITMRRALLTLGAQITEDRDPAAGTLSYAVDGLDGPPHADATVDCGMGATVGRFLLPMLASGRGQFALDAHPQLRRRPLGALLAALRAQGATIDTERFPLTLNATGLSGGQLTVDASLSSQFLSGLMMAAPFAVAPTELRFGTLVSGPYVDLTVDAMSAFGVGVRRAGQTLSVARGRYRACTLAVEPDASTASYFLASAALSGSTARLEGFDRRRTRQGDAQLITLLERMGCQVSDGPSLELRGPGPAGSGPPALHGIEANMSECADVFMTLAAVAVFADAPTMITGIGHARVKESDRVAACAENLARLGIEVELGANHLLVKPGTPRAEVRLPTYGDHRVAMAFALIGARVPVVLTQPAVVAKTFPEFFEVWPVTGARVELREETA